MDTVHIGVRQTVDEEERCFVHAPQPQFSVALFGRPFARGVVTASEKRVARGGARTRAYPRVPGLQAGGLAADVSLSWGTTRQRGVAGITPPSLVLSTPSS